MMRKSDRIYMINRMDSRDQSKFLIRSIYYPVNPVYPVNLSLSGLFQKGST